MKMAFTHISTLFLKPTSKLALIIVALGFSASTFSAYKNTQQAPLYSGPSNKTPLSNEALSANSSLEILRKTGDFSLVKTDNGELGWIETKFVSFYTTPEEQEAEEARNAREALQTTEQQVQQQIRSSNTNNNTQAQEEIVETANANPHANRKLNAVVEVISPDADSNTKAMIMGQDSEQVNESDETNNALQTGEPKTEQQQLLDSIDNALTQQVPTAARNNTSSTVVNGTASVSEKKDHNANSTYIFDSSPNANRLELLSEENAHLRNELEKAKNYILKNIPTKDTQTIFEESELLQSQLVLLRTENQRLLENNSDTSFFNAIMIFIFGSLIGFLITKIIGNRKNRNNW